jgi:hypothetical protein
VRKRLLVFVGVLLAVWSTAALQAQPVSADNCDPGGIDHRSLFEAGTATRSELVSATATATSFSFTMRPLYDLSFRVDKEWADKTAAAYKGQDPAALFKKDEIFAAARDGAFPKAVVLKFSQERSAKEIRKDIEKTLKPSGQHRSAAGKRFLDAFKGKFEDGDEAVIRVACSDSLLFTVNNEPRAQVRDAAFAKALLAVWISPGEYPALLGNIREMLKDRDEKKP